MPSPNSRDSDQNVTVARCTSAPVVRPDGRLARGDVGPENECALTRLVKNDRPALIGHFDDAIKQDDTEGALDGPEPEEIRAADSDRRNRCYQSHLTARVWRRR